MLEERRNVHRPPRRSLKAEERFLVPTLRVHVLGKDQRSTRLRERCRDENGSGVWGLESGKNEKIIENTRRGESYFSLVSETNSRSLSTLDSTRFSRGLSTTLFLSALTYNLPRFLQPAKRNWLYAVVLATRSGTGLRKQIGVSKEVIPDRGPG